MLWIEIEGVGSKGVFHLLFLYLSLVKPRGVVSRGFRRGYSLSHFPFAFVNDSRWRMMSGCRF